MTGGRDDVKESSMKAHLRLLVLATLIAPTGVLSGLIARGDWTYVNLHPAGVQNSSALFGVADGQQVGYVGRNEDGLATAAVWSGTAASYISLNPPDTFSQAYGVSQGKQVGQLFFFPEGNGQAVIWSGAANSYVDLQPAGTDSSEVRGIRGSQQVGWVVPVATPELHLPHASLWSGTAASWVDLNPAGAIRSVAYGLDGNQQVGFTELFGSHDHASLWTGAAASWVDLEPAPTSGVFPIIGSVANAVYGGQQVGTVTYNVLGLEVDHAGYWNGTAESWVDLNPDTSTIYSASWANATFDGYQVGQSTAQFCDPLACGNASAAFWHGTRESWVDLESFLPANYIGSNAFGVWTDGHTIQVAGAAYNSTLGRSEAILWINTVPEPSSFAALAVGVVLLVLRRSGQFRRLDDCGPVFSKQPL
jgi:hypothetical protein